MKLKLVALALLSTTSIAFAADPAARTYTKAPVVAAPIWSGFYIGAMGGYNWSGQMNTSGFTVSSGDFSGGFGGGTIGYNWQPSPFWMFGIEADGAGADIKFASKNPGPPTGIFGQETINALGSVTGRLGYTADAALLYVKGGFAWANNKFLITDLRNTFSETKLHTGYTVGAGVEYMFAPSWSAKVEYMYADLSRQQYFDGVLANTELGASLHTVKGGINYHFNWGTPAPAVTK